MPKAYIGTSGYLYNHWFKVFYPENSSQDKWLEYYSKFFDTVELNVTFYRLPLETTFKNWYQRTPNNFSFTLKGSRFITHIKKLKDCRKPLELFFNRAKYLQEKLGMILWQLPPRFKADIQRLDEFCSILIALNSSLRHSFEFRDESWFCKEIYKVLKKHNFALVVCDYPFELVTKEQTPCSKRKFIQILETADFIYSRRHGVAALYASNYSNEELKQDAVRINKWLKDGKDVYVYFNNDAYGYAVQNALKLKEILNKR